MRILAFVAAFLLVAAGAEAKTLVVSAARMVDVSTGRVIADPRIVVVDGRITAAGPADQIAIPAGAERLDLPGVTLLPGLIDMHVHLDSPADIGGYRGLEYGDRFWSVLQVVHAANT